ncbi:MULTISPECIES: ECF transporter S component [Clostridium]|uniref:ECF transporter S component n=1 Tax=Clostridium cibarium TaxID=2762247 RepID=A0ABR8PSP2_9CLOT|nr:MULTISPECIES: ECF transporter S component [Clostridium]MBD7911189.1 ECF transporter S component [Clostridium cibarium]
MEESKGKVRLRTKDMVETALLIALVFVSTAFINIRLPFLSNGGLVHLGTVMLFIAAIVFGKEKGAIAGAVGMAIFDLSSGWALWAPFTFVVRGVMGYMLGSIAWSKKRDGNSLCLDIVGIILSGAWMIFGYYITEGILYGNWITPVASMPGNLTQIIVGLILALPISKILKRYAKYI